MEKYLIRIEVQDYREEYIEAETLDEAKKISVENYNSTAKPLKVDTYNAEGFNPVKCRQCNKLMYLSEYDCNCKNCEHEYYYCGTCQHERWKQEREQWRKNHMDEST